MNEPKRWPARCSLMGCMQPRLRPHHHHFFHGHLVTGTCTCTCTMPDQPGTSPEPKD